MQSPWISKILLSLENPYIVAGLTLAAILLRVCWVRYRTRHPLRAKPADPMLEKLDLAIFVPAIILWLALPLSSLLVRTALAVAGYFAMSALARAGLVAYRKGRPLPAAAQASTAKDGVLEFIDTVIIALVLVFGIVRPFLMQTFFIPSGSMEPTLLINDKLIANKFVLRFRLPHPGEVIVFDPPTEALVGAGNAMPYQVRAWLQAHPGALTSQEMNFLGIYLRNVPEFTPYLHPITSTNKMRGEDARDDARRFLMMLREPPRQREPYIKRAIGGPGDRIRIDPAKGVYRNGKLLSEPYLPEGSARAATAFPVPPPAPGPMPRFTNTDTTNPDQYLADANQFIMEFLAWLRVWYAAEQMYPERIAPHVKHGEFVVPPGSVFVMGDNRASDGSFDSRYWGAVPQRSIKARAVSTFWPLNRLKLL